MRDRWREIDEILQAALDLEPSQQPAFLDAACRGDLPLRREVDSLLESYQQGENLIESPPSQLAAELLAAMKSRSYLDRTIGHYQIVEQIGEGAMGEVYRARDLVLKRDVAIKILPPEWTADSRRLRHFEEEARAAALLSHPNIVTIHEIVSVDDVPFMVMELVSGGTLRTALASARFRVKEALRIACQVAEGMARAHAAGIVHGDLKPENIMISADGLVKILDFGLARLQPASAGMDEAHDNPADRVIRGTPGYLSPEQVSGSPSTVSCDQFSFGVTLHEMLTGVRPFAGANIAEILDATLHEEPKPLAELTPGIPLPLRRLVQRCLSKNPEARYASTLDLARDLRMIEENLDDAPPGPSDSTRKKPRLAPGISLTILTAAMLLAGALLHFRPTSSAALTARFDLHPVAPASFSSHGVPSPDGTHMVFAETTSGSRTRLWVRVLASGEARPLAGTENGAFPFWSPDSQSLGFFATGRLMAIDLLGAGPRDVCAAPDGRGGAWNTDGTILFAPTTRDPLYRVPATGGTPAQVTSLAGKNGEYSHRWPFFLPDGRHFLFLSLGVAGEDSTIMSGSLDSGPVRKLVAGAIAPSFAHPDRLLFVRRGDLFTQRFTLSSMQVEGSPEIIARRIQYSHGRGDAAYAVSTNGQLTYMESPNPNSRLTWFDRHGRNLGVVGPAEQLRCPELSRNEKIAAVEAFDPKRQAYDICLINLTDGSHTKLSRDLSDDSNAAWSPDGDRIAFTSNREGHRNILVKSLKAGSYEVVLPGNGGVDHWSADGRYVLYTVGSIANLNDLWVLPLFGERRPFAFLNTRFNEVQGRLSPNSRWLAYSSNESGRLETYVRSFPEPEQSWKVSSGGGAQPIWRSDGKELFFIAADKSLMSVDIAESRDADPLRVGAPKVLFPTRVSGLTNARNHYAVTRDGQRFLINTLVEDPAYRPITVVLNWEPERR